MRDKRFLIITGAFGGVGIETCKSLIDSYSLILIDKENNEKYVDELMSKSKNEVIFFEIDFLKTESFSILDKFLVENEIKIEGIVCLAGVMKKSTLFDTSLNDWDNIMKINLTSNFIISRICTPYMKKQKYGKIIFISSIFGKIAAYDLLSYSVSKSALIQFSKSLALELRDFNIMVNCICPGFINTNMYKEFKKSDDLNANWFYLFGGVKNKLVPVYDVVRTIKYLLQQESISGEEIVIDYGYSIS